MSYQSFRHASAALGQGPGATRQRVALDTVAQLQRRLLTLPQLEAVRQLQDGMQAMAAIQASVNALIALHGLPLAAISLPQLGLVQHQLQGVLFEHELAAAKLAQGGQPLTASGHALPLTRAA